MSKQEVRKQLKEILIEYGNYEEALIEKQVADGGPRPMSYSFNFARFYNWLNDLEQL